MSLFSFNQTIKTGVRRTLASAGYEIRRSGTEPVPLSSSTSAEKYAAELWTSDSEFQRLWELSRDLTLLPELDAYVIYQLLQSAVNLPGDMAEVGVYRGGMALIIANSAQSKHKRLHLFDTFAGMPATDREKDWHRPGDFADTSLEEVTETLSGFNRISFYQGLFPDTADPIKTSTFCFVHIDVDIYRSVRDCCEFFYPRMETGGVMLFDDYGKFTCPGAKLAVDEYFTDKPEKPYYLPSGQCFVHKQLSSST